MLAAATQAPAEHSFTVMGGSAYLVVHDPFPGAIEAAEQRLRHLESIWSRFLLDSDITRANTAAGAAVVVDDDTLSIVLRAIEGWKQTRGRFDISVLPALVHHGYTASAVGPVIAPPVAGRLVGICDRIDIDLDARSIRLPLGSAIDLGAIGKGFAADIVAEELIEAGAGGALVNLSGDIVVRGRPGNGDGAWILGIQNPLETTAHVACVALEAGGVATSGITVRRWVDDHGVSRHHVIDPTTAQPSDNDTLTATVIAADGATAEIFATAALILPALQATAMLDEQGLAGVVTTAGGTSHYTPTFEEFRR